MLAEDAGVKLRVRIRERLAFDVAFAQIVGCQRIAQQLAGLANQVVRALRQTECWQRAPLPCLRRRGERRLLEIVRQQQRLVDLGQIVIFGGHPEDRHAFHPERFDLFCQRQYRSGLSEAKAGVRQTIQPAGRVTTANAPFAQPLNISQRRLGRSPGSVLPLERIGYSAPHAPGSRFTDLAKAAMCCGVRLRRIELADGWGVRKIIAKEAGGVRNAVEGDAVGDHAIVSRQQRREQQPRRKMRH